MVTSLRAYEIADRFRARNVPVLMGGPHATFYSDEMGEHADGVCVGEGEEIFPKMLEDAAAGRLQKFYRRDTVASMAGMPTPRWDLLDRKHYAFYSPHVIQQSRGCPYTCDFCAERRLNGDHGYRDRPAAEIVEEIKRSGNRHIFFAASQFVGHKGRAMELLEAMIPLKIRWSALFSPRFGLDGKFLDLAKKRRSSCTSIWASRASRRARSTPWQKKFNHSDSYDEMIANLNSTQYQLFVQLRVRRRHGRPRRFSRHASIPSEQHKVPAAYFNVLVPLRGTPLYDQHEDARAASSTSPIWNAGPGVSYFTPGQMTGRGWSRQRHRTCSASSIPCAR